MGSDKKIIVLFPGGDNRVDRPMLYYADLKYEAKGYECLKINYGDGERKSLSDIENIKNIALSQMGKIDFSKYDDILFVSKSLGTIIAGQAAQTLVAKVRHIYLTPLQGTLEYIKGQDIQIVLAGTADKYLESVHIKPLQ